MHRDDHSSLEPQQRAAEVRRRVLDAATQLRDERKTRTTVGVGLATIEREPPPTVSTDLFMILLHDRLPIWIRTLDGLADLAGKADVTEILVPVAQATIGFYVEIQTAGITTFNTLDQVAALRRALRAHDLGPHNSVEPLTRYLTAEQQLGRIAADVDPEVTAELLLGACLQQAVKELLIGKDAVPPRDRRAERIVRGLRLGTG